MSSPYLVATQLAHAFDYPLYREVSLAIGPSESVAVMGRSGSGKSTLLHTLAGLIEPLEGKVELMGRDLYRISESEKEILRRNQTGIVFQQHYLFKGMTGRENVEIAAMLARQEIEETLFESLEIDTVIDQKVSELSGGQQQRVSLARVLSKKPRVIFADEPTGNLDLETSELVMRVLLDYVNRHEAALFMVTHDPLIARKCNRIYLLEGEHLLPYESTSS
ncbi:ABC transporter ATP-binding protein [Nitratifractor sp.]|uniref:ABC transporter ATP-binding protein n=1 Tax=Nitratifractor sp. TaxID=2268144 RepID=UPI0025DCE9AA|nr:ATP-binding cassette domain-containing protein [Nitratifractor sp.]